jgi:hypothetical protein
LRLRILYISLLLCLTISIFVEIANCSSTDHIGGILWTTDASGKSEVQTFGPGDAVYLKTNGDLYPLIPKANYTVYVFEGTVLNYTTLPEFSIKLTEFVMPSTFKPFNITTDENGRIGSPWPTPTLIWDHATFGNFTVLLDYQGQYDLNSRYPFSYSGGAGLWDGNDVRDDLCSFHAPSFNVVPEPATIALTITAFGAFAGYILAKRKNFHKET